MSSRPQLELHFSRSRKGREVAAVSFCDAVSFQEGRPCHSTFHFAHLQRTRLNTQKITLLKTESFSVPIEIDTQKSRAIAGAIFTSYVRPSSPKGTALALMTHHERSFHSLTAIESFLLFSLKHTRAP
jgi:hypothetical protein